MGEVFPAGLILGLPFIFAMAKPSNFKLVWCPAIIGFAKFRHKKPSDSEYGVAIGASHIIGVSVHYFFMKWMTSVI